MSTRMLIDATHPEETRVVVVKGTRLEEFDFESANKKQLKGNIYLAKVTRVEPSLQAAFIEYGGNRHGFLAFSEIHPDYYQIPVADRQALLDEQAAQDDDEDEDEDDTDTGHDEPVAEQPDEPEGEPVDHDGDSESGDPADDAHEPGTNVQSIAADAHRPETLSHEPELDLFQPPPVRESGDQADDDAGDRPFNEATEIALDDTVESVGADDSVEEAVARARRPRKRPLRSYKIQEVIKRRQILLVQVVKEERGNKGAALTTYLSLAGRYCVLMPNSPRGGGISRKIQNAADRKRLKSITADLDVPEGMGVIVRTAGMNRTKPEIKRDFEYLLRLWNSVRDLTLKSSAPAVVYEEGDLIKRAIRDLYSKDIEEILVEGEDGYRQAKDFMRMLMPSHAKNVQPYRERVPLLHRFQVEHQLDLMFNPVVQLRSGGYIVINTTEALVAVDVNSGRSTREQNIEETATKTNLEAAEEVARQMRLRDLAGLIVIDFIDMEDSRNNRAVERKLKDCLKTDRARIQLGRISPFGLLEMSRQRLHPGLLEASTHTCVHCRGAGVVRSTESSALHVLRAIEDEGMKERSSAILVKTSPTVALYVLNQKRHTLQQIEARYDFSVTVDADDSLIPPEHRIERLKPRTTPVPTTAVNMSSLRPMDLVEDDDEVDAEVEESDVEAEADEADVEARDRDSDSERGGSDAETEDGKRRRRRRRRRGGRREDGSPDDREDGVREARQPGEAATDGAEAGSDGDADQDGGEDGDSAESGDGGLDANGDRRRRRRGRRGGRRRREGGEPGSEASVATPEAPVYAVTHWANSEDTAAAPSEADLPFPAGEAETVPFAQVARLSEPAPRSEEAAQPEVAITAPQEEQAPAPTVTHWPETPAEAKADLEPVVFPEAHDPDASGAVVNTGLAVEAPTPVAIESAPTVSATEPEAPVAVAEAEAAPAPAAEPEDDGPTQPPRRGWWQRRFSPS